MRYKIETPAFRNPQQRLSIAIRQQPTPPPPTRNTVNSTDIARHLSLEPHDDAPDLTAAERVNREILRMEYVSWRSDNPFSDVIDWTLHSRTIELEG